jgi:hypothetical protein
MEDIDHLLAKSINIIFVDKIGDGIQKKMWKHCRDKVYY